MVEGVVELVKDRGGVTGCRRGKFRDGGLILLGRRSES